MNEGGIQGRGIYPNFEAPPSTPKESTNKSGLKRAAIWIKNALASLPTKASRAVESLAHKIASLKTKEKIEPKGLLGERKTHIINTEQNETAAKINQVLKQNEVKTPFEEIYQKVSLQTKELSLSKETTALFDPKNDQVSNQKKLEEIYDRLNDRQRVFFQERGGEDQFTIAQSNTNRWTNKLPYNSNLLLPDLYESEGFYLSASPINVGSQNYVAAQAPLKETINDFWKGVIKSNSNKIVTLVMPEEKEREKCFDYWSSSAPQVIPGLGTIQKTKEEILAKKAPDGNEEPQSIVKRTFQFTPEGSNTSQTIEQFHYQNWPDFGIPDQPLFLELIDHVDNSKLETKGPIFAHCSAGCGRTGTFVAAHSLKHDMLENPNQEAVNVEDRVHEMRTQRYDMVQTVDQLEIVYQSVKQFASSSEEKIQQHRAIPEVETEAFILTRQQFSELRGQRIAVGNLSGKILDINITPNKQKYVVSIKQDNGMMGTHFVDSQVVHNLWNELQSNKKRQLSDL